MSDETGSTVTLVVETQPDLPSFLDNKVDLKRLAREIGRASGRALEVLMALLNSTDERVRLEAAKKLIEFQVSVAKEISNDQMQRLIAEIKLVRQPKQKLIPAGEGEGGEAQTNKPVVDFHTIRTIG